MEGDSTAEGIAPAHGQSTAPGVAEACGVPWEIDPTTFALLEEYFEK